MPPHWTKILLLPLCYIVLKISVMTFQLIQIEELFHDFFIR